VGFHGPNEMTSCVALKKLVMNNVNVFAWIKDHEFMQLYFACSHPRLGARNPVTKNSM
jgi:hypothetical protein